MPEGDDLRLPLEIPWRLASTTLPFSNNEPDQTSISLFTFEPDEDALTSKFPDERIIFVKVSVSISPASFPPGTPPFGGEHLGEGVPCYHMLLDLKVRPKSGATGGIRPYFHAAAPLNRRMLQTGVVGHELFEGEAANQSMGKSGSQLHESLNSESRTNSASASAGFSIGGFGASGSVRTTSTDLSSNRNVSQTVDTTNRQASEERRELVSHSTKVENILNLLNAKYVGTPFLSFSLNPRPLELLSLDPTDPNLWFKQLLERRSRGIEGLQEFTAVLIVPRVEDFCIQTRLRRVCLLDAPPRPLTYDERYNSSAQQLGRVLNYLDRAFPTGTPVDELDVEVLPSPTPPQNFPRPVIEFWMFAGFQGTFGGTIGPLARLISPSPGPGANTTSRTDAFYKHPLELWLDVLRDEYQREVERSPLERGVLLGENRILDTCFAFVEGALVLSNSSSTVTPLAPLPIPPRDFDIGGVRGVVADRAQDVRARAVETITRWTALESMLATILNNRRTFPTRPKGLDARLTDVVLQRWATLEPQDPRNLDFNAVGKALGLTAEDKRTLKAAGTTDLRSIARMIQVAPRAASYNAEVKKLKRDRKGAAVEPIPLPLSPARVEAIRRHIADALSKSFAQSNET
ncbi:hypothetical protein BH20VER1_BH20VER1_06330 [soil metagenome]